MERKIGETFEFEGKTYKTVEEPSCFCDFCDLEKECYDRGRSNFEKVAGSCSAIKRKDNYNVFFKEVKNMKIKDNELTVNIPEGMEIDLQNSNFDTGVIKFKKKELTYKDIGDSLNINTILISISTSNTSKINAIDRLMDIARYYNGDWKPDWENPNSLKFYIWYDTLRKKYDIEFGSSRVRNDVYFKRKEDVQSVIDNPNFREILDAIFKN